ncbi:MAG: undecaprenyl-diphosphate phosphatase [Pseudomonadota bacterium]
MDIIQLVVLSIVQGLTEFLPVSSSAHLILVPVLSDWPDQGLLFDVAAHLGSLLAVLLYFRRDLIAMASGFCQSLAERRQNGDSRLAWAVLLGTIPLGLAGILSKDYVEAHLRGPLVIAAATLVFGGLLWWAAVYRRRSDGQRTLGSLNGVDVLVVGLAQAVALIPGTSRSGITITAALFRRFTPTEAAHFSFLLSIPAILMPFSLYLWELLNTPDVQWQWGSLALIVALSFASALTCIHLFLKVLERIGMMPFVLYRLALGALLLVLFL